MSIEEENLTRQRRIWEEIFNEGNLKIIPELGVNLTSQLIDAAALDYSIVI